MPEEVWKRYPSNNNAVERKTGTAKIAYLLQSGKAFVNLYKLDKSFCTKLIAAVSGASVSYSSRSSSARAAAAARR